METLQRILLLIVAMSILFVIVTLALSIFIVFWPVLLIGIIAAAIYAAIRNRFGPPPPPYDHSYREQHKTTIIIEHKADEDEDKKD